MIQYLRKLKSEKGTSSLRQKQEVRWRHHDQEFVIRLVLVLNFFQSFARIVSFTCNVIGATVFGSFCLFCFCVKFDVLSQMYNFNIYFFNIFFNFIFVTAICPDEDFKTKLKRWSLPKHSAGCV